MATLENALREAVREAVVEALDSRLKDVLDLRAGRPPEEQTEQLLTRAEVAEMLHVDPRSIRRLVLGGEIPAPFQVGSRPRWRCNTLATWIAAEESRQLPGRSSLA